MEIHLCEASYLDHDIILFSSGSYLLVGGNSLKTIQFGGIYKRSTILWQHLELYTKVGV